MTNTPEAPFQTWPTKGEKYVAEFWPWPETCSVLEPPPKEDGTSLRDRALFRVVMAVRNSDKSLFAVAACDGDAEYEKRLDAMIQAYGGFCTVSRGVLLEQKRLWTQEDDRGA